MPCTVYDYIASLIFVSIIVTKEKQIVHMLSPYSFKTLIKAIIL